MLGTWELALVVVAWMVAGGSPGPATLAIASSAMSQGRTAGLAMAAGVMSGSALWGLAAVLGMGTIMQANVWVFEFVRYAGAAYLLYLAIKNLRSAFSRKELLVPQGSGKSLFALWRSGFAIHITNPKAVMGWGAVYALVADPTAPVSELFLLYAVLASASSFVFLVMVPCFPRRSLCVGIETCGAGLNSPLRCCLAVPA